jgi:hypothetical protein
MLYIDERITDLKQRQSELDRLVMSLDMRITASQRQDVFHPELNKLYAALGDALYNLGRIDARLEDVASFGGVQRDVADAIDVVHARGRCPVASGDDGG